MSTDDLFFREWAARLPGERRSLTRARALIGALGIAGMGLPVLTVVGSKGKGTAAAYASAHLSAAGLRVVTITSPALRGNRERIRLSGRAVSAGELDSLAKRLAAEIRRLPARTDGEGYLSPSGLFIIAGVLHALSVAADVLVVEAGRGGGSDEASLFPPTVAAVTPVFEEHLGELGDSVTAIARDKASVVGPATGAVLSAPQRADVEPVLSTTVAGITRGRIRVETVTPGTNGIAADLLPGGLGSVNAELGCAGARRLLEVTRAAPPTAADLRATLSSIVLPGRLSWHRLPGSQAAVLIDQAVTGPAATAALRAGRARWGAVDHVLVSLPDDKDLAGVTAVLRGFPVTFVELKRTHLRFDRELPPGWARLGEDELTVDVLRRLGPHIAALGTVSFAALLLELLDVPTERLFTPSPPR
jgi:folylpolyglutamate synthase/dihydropteroate synthase